MSYFFCVLFNIDRAGKKRQKIWQESQVKGVLSYCFYVRAKLCSFCYLFPGCFLGGRSMAFLSLMKEEWQKEGVMQTMLQLRVRKSGR